MKQKGAEMGDDRLTMLGGQFSWVNVGLSLFQKLNQFGIVHRLVNSQKESTPHATQLL